MSLVEQDFITKTLKKDVTMIGVVLAICITLMIINFYYIVVKDKQDKQAIAIAGEMRILSQSVAKHAANAADGVQEAFKLLRKRRDDFDAGILGLKNGIAELDLPASSDLIRQNELLVLETTWDSLRDEVDTILGRQELLVSLHRTAKQLLEQMPKISQNYQSVVNLLLTQNADIAQIEASMKQVLLAQNISQHIQQVLAGGDKQDVASIDFAKEAAQITKIHKALLLGSKGLKIPRVVQPEAVALLEAVTDSVLDIEKNIGKIQKTANEMGMVNSAAFEIYIGSQNLLDQATTLAHAYTLASETRFIGVPTGYMLGATCLLLFMWLSYRTYAQAKLRLLRTNAQHKSNRAAVWRLLDELANLADGDLTVKATVGEDMTGAIAESVNYAIDALRKLVFTINETAVSVSSSAQESQATASHLAKASESQAKEIVGASAAIHAIAHSIEHVSTNANSSAAVAKESVEIAKRGVKVVQNTMLGMENIREQIQNTSKQIKRLGESTQEIGHIVALINDMADQTHVLALNASIQAAMAGDAGRGFAVVAEEVQHLAERATQATKQIETLVYTIQGDTNDTVIAMEQTTQEVVAGANLSNEAGVALAQIESVSLKLADLIHNISSEASIQAQTSNQVSDTMEVIKDIANQTAAGASATANSIGQLAELAIQLRESVAGFKLPVDEDQHWSRTG